MKRLLLCSALVIACSCKSTESTPERVRDPKRAVALVYQLTDADSAKGINQATQSQLLTAVRARLSALHADADVSWASGRLRITLADPSEDELNRTRMSIRDDGQLEVRVVQANHPIMLELVRWAHTQEQARATDVRREIDHWAGRAGRSHDDNYLSAPSAKSITSLLARHPEIDAIPKGLSIVFEKTYQQLAPGQPSKAARWRSYLVGERAGIRGHIRDAKVASDPRSGRPHVEVTLDEEGKARFAEITGRILGGKLAILVDGTVQSAPVVVDPITGGKLWITMSGNDPRTMIEEARALALALRSPSLPIALQLMSATELAVP